MRKLILLFTAALMIIGCQKEEVVDTVSFEEIEASETSKSNTKLNIVISKGDEVTNWGDFDVTNVVNTDYGSIVTLQNGKKVWSLTYNSDTQRAILDFHNRETAAGDIIPNADRTEGFSFYDDNNGPLDNSLIVITIVNSSLTSKGGSTNEYSTFVNILVNSEGQGYSGTAFVKVTPWWAELSSVTIMYHDINGVLLYGAALSIRHDLNDEIRIHSVFVNNRLWRATEKIVATADAELTNIVAVGDFISDDGEKSEIYFSAQEGVSSKKKSSTSKGATLPSLSRITFNGIGHYNNTISMEFENLEYYNSSSTGSEVVFSASDPYAGTFWITIKMNETGVPYGYVLNNTNGSNDYISGGNLEVVAAPGQVRLIGRAKKGIGTTQYWTQTMTFVMYQ